MPPRAPQTDDTGAHGRRTMKNDRSPLFLRQNDQPEKLADVKNKDNGGGDRRGPQ